MTRTFSLAAAVLALGTAASAQQQTTMPNIGSSLPLIAPKVDLPLRVSPPGAFFQGKGQQIDTANTNETFRVLDERNVPTIFGFEQWLKVQSVEEQEKFGWIFSGQGAVATIPNANNLP